MASQSNGFAMRFLLFSLLLCAALMGSPALAETIRVLVQRSPLAGSQYYAANAVWTRIRVGDRLTLVREADNRHDRRAVRVEWQGQQLGYVPRAENRAVSHALDAGERLEGRVLHLRAAPGGALRAQGRVRHPESFLRPCSADA